jgi:phospholipid-binding lipoprotein MlaA
MQAIANDMEDEFLGEFDEEFIVKEEEYDPFKHYNILMTGFNDWLYINALEPTAKGYSKVIPENARTSINNFFENILYPLRFINNILQFKFLNAVDETNRFLINSTIGMVGLFDPAQEYFDIYPHKEDFGQTLGYWGVGSGYHIVLPFFGPSNIRDTLSLYPNGLLNPVVYTDTSTNISLTLYKTVNNTSLVLGQYETLTKDAIELYPYLKDIYEQNRNQLIKE